MPLLKSANERRRRRTAPAHDGADPTDVVLAWILVERLQHAHPHRRDAGRDRHALGYEQFEQALGVEERPRKHLRGADHRAGERKPPRVDVKHWDDRQDDVLLAHGHSEHVDLEPRFCAVCIVAVTPTSQGGEVSLCCSGHPLPRLVDAEGRVREVGVPGTIAGVLPDLDLEDVTVPLSPGQSLVLFTDGITEQHTDSEFFEDRLPEVLSAAAALRPTTLAARLLEQATAFAAAEPDDDMAVLVIRVSPERQRRQGAEPAATQP